MTSKQKSEHNLSRIPGVSAGQRDGKDVETETGKAHVLWNPSVEGHIPVKTHAADPRTRTGQTLRSQTNRSKPVTLAWAATARDQLLTEVKSWIQK